MGKLYSHLKVFNYPDKVRSLPAGQPRILSPVHIRLKPTNVCNHNCWYCAYRAEDLQLGRDMARRDQIPREKMMEILDDFADMGVEAITFSGGGEPLVYPYMKEVLRKLAAGPIRYACLTNGSRLKGEVAELLAGRGSWVRVSLDAWDGPSYAQSRGVGPEEFARVMDNLAAFIARGGPCLLGAVFIVSQVNAPHVHDILRQLHDIGIKSVKVSPCIISNDGGESNRYHQPFRAMVQEQIARGQEEFAGSGMEIFNAYHEQLETFDKDYSWCPSLQLHPVVGADQNVYACHDKAYNLKEGLLFSIKERRFAEGWLADKEQFFRIDPRKVCNHHCVANERNKMLIEFLEMDPGHAMFV